MVHWSSTSKTESTTFWILSFRPSSVQGLLWHTLSLTCPTSKPCMDSDLTNEEAKIPVYYSVTKNIAFRIVCCLSGKIHTFSHRQLLENYIKMRYILVCIPDLRNKMDPIRSAALTPHHTLTVTSCNGIFWRFHQSIKNFVRFFFSVPCVRALRTGFKQTHNSFQR